MTTLRIGIHPNNPTLTALSRTSFLQERLGGRADVRFVDVGPGPRSIDFIGANLVDVSGTGATPPIIGQAAGVPLVYIATSEARPLGGLVVAAAELLVTERIVVIGVGECDARQKPGDKGPGEQKTLHSFSPTERRQPSGVRCWREPVAGDCHNRQGPVAGPGIRLGGITHR